MQSGTSYAEGVPLRPLCYDLAPLIQNPPRRLFTRGAILFSCRDAMTGKFQGNPLSDTCQYRGVVEIPVY